MHNQAIDSTASDDPLQKENVPKNMNEVLKKTGKMSSLQPKNNQKRSFDGEEEAYPFKHPALLKSEEPLSPARASFPVSSFKTP